MKDVKIEKEDKENGLVVLKVETPFSFLEKYKKEAIEKIKQETELDGFRKGQVPEDVLMKKFDSIVILKEAVNFMIDSLYLDILKEQKIQPISYPNISVTKLAENNPVCFNIEVNAYPELELPDYKKIASTIKKEDLKVKKDDIQKVFDNVLNMQKNTAEKSEEKNEENKKNTPKKQEEKLTDEFIKTLGPFSSVKDFESKVKEDLQKDKDRQSIENHRGAIAEAILKKIDLKAPLILVEAEIDKIMFQVKEDVKRIGNSWEDYLKNQKKEEKDFREEVRLEAEKRVVFDIVLKEIAKKEKIVPKSDEVQRQVDLIKANHKDAEEENVRLYVKSILINEEVMKFLEK